MTSQTALLLRPKLQGARNGLRRHGRARIRGLFLGALGLLFWVGTFAVTWRVLLYLQSTPQVGLLLAKKILALLVVLSLSILLYSNVIVAISTLFLSRELNFVFGTPVRRAAIFYSKLVEILVGSSWMILVFLTPVLLAYGVVFGAQPLFYAALPALLLFFFAIPAALAAAFVILLANVFPARKLRDLFFLVLLLAVSAMVFFLRYLRPELLVNPEVRRSVRDYVLGLQQVGSPYLPSTWLTEVTTHLLGLGGAPDGRVWLFAVLLVSTAGVLVIAAEALAGRLYFSGWSRTQEARRVELDAPTPSRGDRLKARLAQFKALQFFPKASRHLLEKAVRLAARVMGTLVPGVHRPIVEKDLLVFFRDTAQWSQLLLVGAITAVYILNVYVIRLARGIDLFWMKTIISFLNIGMVGFVVSAICLRFVFPAVSIEGEAFWILRAGPVRMPEVLRSKLWTYLPPLLLLGLVLVVASNWLLEVHPFIATLGVATVVLITLGVGAMGVGLGAQYPDFRYENVARISLGYGGILYMLLSMAYVGVVVVIEAVPVYLYMKWDFCQHPVSQPFLPANFCADAAAEPNRLAIAIALALVVALTATAVWIPLRHGRAALENPG